MTDSLKAPEAAGERQFPCSSCGAGLSFKPGTAHLACPHCGARNEIPVQAGAVEELDFRTALRRAAGEQPTHEVVQIPCSGCGAQTTVPEQAAAAICPFCGASLVFTTHTSRLIKPGSLLPFKIDQRKAFECFRTWIGKLWFAPGDLKQYARSEHKLAGVYVPFWTYDSDAMSRYSGERGDYYYVTESYNTQENGRTVTRSRQVRHTRWTAVGGAVQNSFDDILVPASNSLPRKYAERLEPWDLENLVAYADDYLSGFRAESYQVNLEEGFERARKIMDEAIRTSVCRDIGGDEQRVHSIDTRFGKITFKHLLLPVWLSAYRFRERVFRIMINARTGEVQGERPYSAWKIAAAVLAGAAFIAVMVLLFSQGH